MSYSRHSFDGSPRRHPYHQNQSPRGGGSEYNQQAGFFQPQPTNGPGPQNHGETGNPWQNNRNRNNHGGRWENGHQGQRRGQRHNNGQKNYRPGNNNFYNGSAADQSQGHNHHTGGYNSQRRKQRRRGGRRNNRNQYIPLEPTSPSSGSTEDSILLPDFPEDQSQIFVPQFGIPPCPVDWDGDVEMTEAPPLDSEVIRLLKEGTIALHEVTTIMIEYAKHYG